MNMRINKYIASAGIASRRKADELIKEGKIKVNGLAVFEPGREIAEGDVVEVDGHIIKPQKKSVYIMLNKPSGFVTTAKDERGRPTVLDLMSDISERVFPVGRLDYNTSGLLIMTNDGEFANLMMHPRNKIYKTYRARVSGLMSRNTASKLRQGVVIDGVCTAPAQVEILKQGDRSTVLEIRIYEGRNRQIRKMCDAVGHKVLELHRAAIGDVTLGHLKEGHYKKMNPADIEMLKRAAAGAGTKEDRDTENRKPAVEWRPEDQRMADRNYEEPKSTHQKKQNRPAARKPDRKPVGKFDGKSDGRPVRKSGGKPGRKADGKFDGKSDGRPVRKSGGKADGKLGGKSDRNPDVLSNRESKFAKSKIGKPERNKKRKR